MEYDRLALFGQRYDALRSEDSLSGKLRFPMDVQRENILLWSLLIPARNKKTGSAGPQNRVNFFR